MSNVTIPNHAKTPSYHTKPSQSNSWFVYLYWRWLIKSLHHFIYLFAWFLPHLSINTTYYVGKKSVGKENILSLAFASLSFALVHLLQRTQQGPFSILLRFKIHSLSLTLHFVQLVAWSKLAGAV